LVFAAKHAALRNQSKDWMAWNQENVSRVERNVCTLTVVPVSFHNKNSTWRVGLVKCGYHNHLTWH